MPGSAVGVERLEELKVEERKRFVRGGGLLLLEEGKVEKRKMWRGFIPWTVASGGADERRR